MVYKINAMSETIKFKLPKVQLKIKTTNLETIESEVNLTPIKERIPSVFQERVKMKKEIQESYIRFRRHKKNNYIKQYSSAKRSYSDKRVGTVELKKISRNPEDKIDLSLDTQERERCLILHKYSKKESQLHLLQKIKQNDSTLRRELLTGSCRSSQTKDNILARHFSLYDTEIINEIKQKFELKGKQWHLSNHNESKRIYNHLMKINQQHHKNKNISGKSSSFRIQAWKPDKLSESKAYFGSQHLEIDY